MPSMERSWLVAVFGPYGEHKFGVMARTERAARQKGRAAYEHHYLRRAEHDGMVVAFKCREWPAFPRPTHDASKQES